MASSNQVAVTVNIRNPWLMSVFVALLVISFRISGTECGKVNVVEETSASGAWPSFVIVKNLSDKYFCPGTLISKKHVLVGAYCTYDDYGSLSPTDMVVILGAFNLSSTNEEGVVRASVTKIHVHPDWERDRINDDANLAILVLSDDIIFTDYIRPARLPAADDVAINSSTVDVLGTAVGWSRLTKDLAITQASVTASYCEALYETGRIFCSEYVTLGGFFVRTDDAWVQYGVLCTIRRDPLAVHDDVAVYTNIKLFTNWIAETIQLSENMKNHS